MKCPHCQVEIHAAFFKQSVNSNNAIGQDPENMRWWELQYMACPNQACGRAIIRLNRSDVSDKMVEAWIAFPRNATRIPAPMEVPAHLREDYDEAGAVLDLSPKASAALSRRCLQGVLRDQGYAQKDLAPAIDAALASRTLPAAVAGNLDAIRNIGNFAAHPMKDTNSGAILDVEPEEAEWTLEVLDSLFDLYYVQPAVAAARQVALNFKLAAAGKPPIKQPAP